MKSFLPPLSAAMQANRRGKSSFVKLNSMFLTQPPKNKFKGPLKQCYFNTLKAALSALSFVQPFETPHFLGTVALKPGGARPLDPTPTITFQ